MSREHSTSDASPALNRAGRKWVARRYAFIKAATYLSGDVHRAGSWYKNEPLPAFASRTAEQLVCEGRTEDVLQYLASLDSGATG